MTSSGSDKPLCGGRKRGGGTCGRPAGWGTPHPGAGRCKLHGGSTRNHVRAAAQQQLEQQAREAFGRLADVSTAVDNPLVALAQLAGDVLAWKDFLAERISDLRQLAYSSSEAGEQIKGEIVLWERALDRCNQVLGTYARLNIDERLAKITERQLEIVTSAITAALAELGLDDQRQQEARDGVVRHLRLVPG